MSTARLSLDPINTEDEDSSAENSSNKTCNHDVSCCLWQNDCDEKTCNELSCEEYCTKDLKCSPFTTLPANIQEINMTTKCCECNYCVRIGEDSSTENSSNTTSEETTTPLSNIEICWLKPDKGPCKRPSSKWYFDPSFGDCKKFIFSGCGGNANNFETYKECSGSCLMNNKSSKHSTFII